MMIYLSAQPDSTYFIWQLEIQLRNFSDLNIQKENIHVLVGYNDSFGLNPKFKEFINENSHLALFFSYEDKRDNCKYASSIRPHIIKKHYLAFPHLVGQTIFYHDSDILFSRIPIINQVSKDICYVSDTRNYLDSSYIIRNGKSELLQNMADLVGIDIKKIIENDANCGGAQYILNGLDYKYWGKVEKDSEALYQLMDNYNLKEWQDSYSESKQFRSSFKGIQAWCADMWAVLWNLWRNDKDVQIHQELLFSWPSSPIDLWEKLAIQHYSGGQDHEQNTFKKTNYTNHYPWYDASLEDIDKKTCSYPIVKAIYKRRDELYLNRIRLIDTSLIIIIPQSKIDKKPYVQAIKDYFNKYFDFASIKILYEEKLKIDHDINNNIELFELSKLDASINNFVFISNLFKFQYLHKLIVDFRNMEQNSYRVAFDLNRNVDLIFSEAFSKILDINILITNLGKFNVDEKTNQQVFFCDRKYLDNIPNLEILIEIILGREEMPVENKYSRSCEEVFNLYQ